MSSKITTETLRQRGLYWKDGEPLRSIEPKWLPYVQDPAWLTIERWFDWAGSVPNEESLSQGSPETARERVDRVNFGVRNYRFVDDPNFLRGLAHQVRETLQRIAKEPRPAGIDHVEPDPSMLFRLAVALTDLRLVKQCPVCGKIFLAKRKDQTACPGDCANTARQRRFRAKGYYNKNRKRNRMAKRAKEERQERLLLKRLKEERSGSR